MFERRENSDLDGWRSSGRRTVPLVTGPRGIGKTTAIRRMARHYDGFAEVDFGRDPGARRLLDGVSCTGDLVRRLREHIGMDPGDGALILLEEVQYSAAGLHALAQLADRESADVVATMSCGTVHGTRDPPPGVETVRIGPVGFGEFCDAMGVDGDLLEGALSDLSAGRRAERDADAELHDMFRRYLVTGGFPGAVGAMSSTGLLRNVIEAVRQAKDALGADARMAMPATSDVVTAIMRSLPVQLTDNGRFTYSKVARRGMGARDCSDGLEWLVSCGCVSVCHRASDVDGPPGSRWDRGYFKVYTDPGLLCGMMDGWASDAVLNGDLGRSPCAVVENCVGWNLSSAGYRALYFSRNRREADFLVPHGGEVTGVVVRSGNNSRRKSLSYLMDEGAITRAVEFGDQIRPGDAERLPLYAAGFPEAVFRR